MNMVQERLQVTTGVYFKGGDFSDVSDLIGLYDDLNTSKWKDKLNHGKPSFLPSERLQPLLQQSIICSLDSCVLQRQTCHGKIDARRFVE